MSIIKSVFSLLFPDKSVEIFQFSLEQIESYFNMFCGGIGLFLKKPSVQVQLNNDENISSKVRAVVFLSLTFMLDTNENRTFAITIPLKSFELIEWI